MLHKSLLPHILRLSRSTFLSCKHESVDIRVITSPDGVLRSLRSFALLKYSESTDLLHKSLLPHILRLSRSTFLSCKHEKSLTLITWGTYENDFVIISLYRKLKGNASKIFVQFQQKKHKLVLTLCEKCCTLELRKRLRKTRNAYGINERHLQRHAVYRLRQ